MSKKNSFMDGEWIEVETGIRFLFKNLILFLIHLRWIGIGFRIEKMLVDILGMGVRSFWMKMVKTLTFREHL